MVLNLLRFKRQFLQLLIPNLHLPFLLWTLQEKYISFLQRKITCFCKEITRFPMNCSIRKTVTNFLIVTASPPFSLSLTLTALTTLENTRFYKNNSIIHKEAFLSTFKEDGYVVAWKITNFLLFDFFPNCRVNHQIENWNKIHILLWRV